MARLLNDALPADIWQARRRDQVAGVGSEDPFAPAQGPNDAMTGPQWQAARSAQLQGKPVALRALGLSEDALSGRRMLDLLARGEGTADAGVGGYDVTYGFGRYWPNGAGKPTDMTLGEIKAAQRGMRTGGNQSTPVGRYQMTEETIGDFQGRMRLSDTEVFTPELQDRMARRILETVGYDDYLAGRKDGRQFQAEAARRWDSISALNGHPHSDRARRRRPAITSEQFQAEIGSLAQPVSAARAR